MPFTIFLRTFEFLSHESYSEQTNTKHNLPPELDAILRLAAPLTWSLCCVVPRYCQKKALTKIVSELSDTQAISMPALPSHSFRDSDYVILNNKKIYDQSGKDN